MYRRTDMLDGQIKFNGGEKLCCNLRQTLVLCFNKQIKLSSAFISILLHNFLLLVPTVIK